MKVSTGVKLFICFNAMSRNVNKQTEFAGHTFLTNLFFSGIFYHAWITTFGRLSYLGELVSLLKVGYNVRCKQV